MQWSEIAMELQNKIRWSLSTTMAGSGFNIAFRDSTRISQLISQDLVAILKEKDEKPDLNLSGYAEAYYKGQRIPIPEAFSKMDS